MNPAIQKMLERYPRDTLDENVNALREILQQLALVGLWRSKFFEHAAFYGGTALRMLYGLDRYSEDLDFSLLTANSDFSLHPYGKALEREIRSFGFDVSFESKTKAVESTIDSAFLKANTLENSVVIQADRDVLGGLHPSKQLKIRLEVDVDPPGGFTTETKALLQPIPFAVRVYSLPDLFAGKIHCLLCRKWRNRVKGRDWYDFVWYAANHPQLHLRHLELRMRQSGDYRNEHSLTAERLREFLRSKIGDLNVGQARAEVEPFVRDRAGLEIWSRTFFNGLIDRVEIT